MAEHQAGDTEELRHAVDTGTHALTTGQFQEGVGRLAPVLRRIQSRPLTDNEFCLMIQGHYILASLLDALGLTDQALAHFEMVLIQDLPGIDRWVAKSLVSRALIRKRAGDLKEFCDDLQRLLSVYQDADQESSLLANAYLGIFFSEGQAFELALPHLRSATDEEARTEISWLWPKLAYLRAIAAQATGQWLESIRWHDVVLDPNTDASDEDKVCSRRHRRECYAQPGASQSFTVAEYYERATAAAIAVLEHNSDTENSWLDACQHLMVLEAVQNDFRKARQYLDLAVQWSGRRGSDRDYYVWHTYRIFLRQHRHFRTKESIESLETMLRDANLPADLMIDAMATLGALNIMNGEGDGKRRLWEASERWRNRLNSPSNPYDQFRKELIATESLLSFGSEQSDYQRAMDTLLWCARWEDVDGIVTRMKEHAASDKDLGKASFVDAVLCMWTGDLHDAEEAIADHDKLCGCEQGSTTLAGLLSAFESHKLTLSGE